MRDAGAPKISFRGGYGGHGGQSQAERGVARGHLDEPGGHGGHGTTTPGAGGRTATRPVRLEAGATPAPEAAIAALRGRPAFEARAAILEINGGLPRARAERLALDGVVADWLINHPPAGLDEDRCAACGGAIVVAASDWRPLADGAVVHHGGGRLSCWRRWQVMRRAEALAALLGEAGAAGEPG